MLCDMTGATATRRSDIAMRLDWRHVAATALGVLAGVVAAAGTVAVAVAGFTLSYDAIRKVGIASGVRIDWSWLLPVSIDGAMAVATVTAVVMQRMGRAVWYPWAVVVTGAGISIACNAVHARMRDHIALDDQTAMAVSAIPALMLVLSVHLLVVLIDAAAQVLDREADPDSSAEVVLVAPVEMSQPAEVVSATPAPVAPAASDGTATSDRDVPAAETPAAATPVAIDVPEPRQSARRQGHAVARDNDIDKQTARRRVKGGESCATVAADLKVNKKTVERWTKDIREARQRAATPASDSDDDKERAS